jgi:TM2 domain-containing membrane protein YozV/Tfp pilus assembly protein PilE
MGENTNQRRRGYKSKVAAGILALILGTFGVHRFFLGQWWGIFYLLLFWTGIPAIVAFVEGIVFLSTNQQNWDAKHNEGKPRTLDEGSGATVVVVLIAVFLSVPLLGILAAVTIPAYQDYTLRAKVTEGLSQANVVKDLISQYNSANAKFPSTNADIGFEYLNSYGAVTDIYLIEEGSIVIKYADVPGSPTNPTVILRPYVKNNQQLWDCTGGTLAKNYRPGRCR